MCVCFCGASSCYGVSVVWCVRESGGWCPGVLCVVLCVMCCVMCCVMVCVLWCVVGVLAVMIVVVVCVRACRAVAVSVLCGCVASRGAWCVVVYCQAMYGVDWPCNVRAGVAVLLLSFTLLVLLLVAVCCVGVVLLMHACVLCVRLVAVCVVWRVFVVSLCVCVCALAVCCWRAGCVCVCVCVLSVVVVHRLCVRFVVELGVRFVGWCGVLVGVWKCKSVTVVWLACVVVSLCVCVV